MIARMCDCALGTIERRPADEPRQRGIPSFWKLASLRRAVRSLLQTLRRRRALPPPVAAVRGEP